jgi:tetratricopeptide (TPR) repeat protein
VEKVALSDGVRVGGSKSAVAIIDPTVCAGCKADNGNSEFPVIGKHPFCSECQKKFYEKPYPQWLKLGLAFLVLLLFAALVHGRKYFQVGREMYVGEKLENQHRYRDAIPHLEQTVRVAPDSDKAVLLLAKAYLLTGNPAPAHQILTAHKQGGFEDTAEFRDVNSIYSRATNALGEAIKAGEISQKSGNAEDGAALMHKAAAEYPEMSQLSDEARYFDGSVAFEHKDYDQFLEISETLWTAHSSSSQYAAVLASALACKYATTGDPAWRQKAEAMLEKSRQLAQPSPDEMKSYAEYSERIRYRLDSRQIIDKPEYDRKFRAKTVSN